MAGSICDQSRAAALSGMHEAEAKRAAAGWLGRLGDRVEARVEELSHANQGSPCRSRIAVPSLGDQDRAGDSPANPCMENPAGPRSRGRTAVAADEGPRRPARSSSPRRKAPGPDRALPVEELLHEVVHATINRGFGQSSADQAASPGEVHAGRQDLGPGRALRVNRRRHEFSVQLALRVKGRDGENVEHDLVEVPGTPLPSVL